jgi:hypothetical protein
MQFDVLSPREDCTRPFGNAYTSVIQLLSNHLHERVHEGDSSRASEADNTSAGVGTRCPGNGLTRIVQYGCVKAIST